MIRNTNNDVDNKRCQLVASVAATLCYFSRRRNKFVIVGRSKNRCNPDYKSSVNKVKKLKEDKPQYNSQPWFGSPYIY
jgi:hypothetical protein